MTITSRQNKTTPAHLLILVAAILAAYYKIFGAGFMSWDDMDYVFHTPDISSGIGWQQMQHWFSSYYIGNYQPLPVFSYALDHVLGGSQPFVYHLDSILWHIADTVLVYFFINSIQGNKWVGLFVALLFAVSPVQTESVSWIAARNKGMNAFFYCMALYMYVGYVKTQQWRRLVWVCLAGLAAYLCKATALSLPLALFAADIWLRRPLRGSRIWLEKLPLAALGVPVAWVTLHAQQQVAFLEHHTQGTGAGSIIYGGYAYVQYIVQLLCPVHLSVIYPYPPAIGFIQFCALAAACGIMALMVIAYRKEWYVLCGGLLFFTVNMLPVLQFVQFGETLMADRYLYISCIGIWFPLVYYLFEWLRGRGVAAIAISACLAAVYLCATIARNDIWLSEMNFWESVVSAFPRSAVAQYSIGALYMKNGNYAGAEQHMQEAVAAEPDNPKAWHNLGALYLREGKATQALDALDRSIAINGYPKAYFSRALLYQGTNKPELALADADKVLETQPQNARAWYIKGDCLEKLNDNDGALESYNHAINNDATEPLFFIRRGLQYSRTGQPEAALDDLNQAVTLNPAGGEALYYRGLIKMRTKQNPCDDLRQALNNGYKPASEALAQACGGK